MDLRHSRQQIGDAGSLFLCVDANMDRHWLLLFLHSLYSFSSSLLNASWRIYLPQAMITGGPHPSLTNVHGFLTNLVRLPSMLVSVGLFTLLSFMNGRLSQAVRDLLFVSIS